MADFNLPTITSLYTTILSLFKDRDDDLARQLRTDVTSPTNMPDKSIRWNVSNKNWEQYNLGNLQWEDLVLQYNIDVNSFNGENAAYYLSWENLTNKPTSFIPATHSHDYGNFNTSINSMQVLRATTEQITNYGGYIGEILYDIQKNTLVIYNGGTLGGFELALKSDLDINTQNITTNTTNIESKADLASPEFTGNPVAPTQSPVNNSTRLATTEFVQASLNNKADLASPEFTGSPLAPTQAVGDDSTKIATTEFVQASTGGSWQYVSTIFNYVPGIQIREILIPDFEDGYEYRIDFYMTSQSDSQARFAISILAESAGWSRNKETEETIYSNNTYYGRVYFRHMRDALQVHTCTGQISHNTEDRSGDTNFNGVWSYASNKKIIRARITLEEAGSNDYFSSGSISLYRKKD